MNVLLTNVKKNLAIMVENVSMDQQIKVQFVYVHWALEVIIVK